MIFRLSSPFRVFAAAVRAWYWGFRGWRVLTTEQEELDRLAVCLNCDFITDNEQCRVCTCYVRAKAMLAAEQCPKRFWLRIKQKHVTV